MTEKIYHYCTTNEVSTIVTNLLIAFDKEDWSSDAALTSLLNILRKENEVLTKGLKLVKGSVSSKDLQEMDEFADKSFVCVKQFLWANTYELDDKKAEDAREVWNVFDKHDLNMHRKSYEYQMAMSKALIENLAEPELKRKMGSLTGVENRFSKFVSASEALRLSFLEAQKNAAEVEKVVAPSVQKRMVRKIVNEQLLTYLDGVVIALPEKYAPILEICAEHIEGANTKARSRKTRNKNEFVELETE